MSKQRRLVLSPRDWDQMQADLERPARVNPRLSALIRWTAAEREAVTDICTHEGLGKACDRCRDTIFDALAALAPFVAERERQAAARALREAAEAWPTADLSAAEPSGEADDWLRHRADRIERGESCPCGCCGHGDTAEPWLPDDAWDDPPHPAILDSSAYLLDERGCRCVVEGHDDTAAEREAEVERLRATAARVAGAQEREQEEA